MRKNFALILAVILLASVFGGCSGSSGGSTAAPTTSAPPTSSAAPSADETNATMIVPQGINYSYTLTDPLDIVWASTSSGNYTYTAISIQIASALNWLPEGTRITQEPIATGTAGTGYLLEAGLADIGQAMNGMAATTGMNDRPPLTKVRALFAYKPATFVVQIVTDSFVQKTGYTSLREVVENKYPAILVSEDIGSSDYATLVYSLDALGTSIEEFQGWGGQIIATSSQTCSDMLQDSQADMMIAQCTPTSSALAELFMTTDAHCYAFDDDLYDALIDRAFTETVIPAGTFDRFDEEVRSVCMGSCRIVSDEMSDELAYEFTRVAVEHLDELAAELPEYRGLTFQTLTDASCSVVPFHPGAIKYFQDIGVLDADGNYIGEPAGWRLPQKSDY